MLKPDDIPVDTYLAGVEPAHSVRVLHVQKAGTDSVNLTYEMLNHEVLKTALVCSDEENLSVAGGMRTWPFDADTKRFKVVAEALRIKLAHLFDPMMAVHTSDAEPLPHQVPAMYEVKDDPNTLIFRIAEFEEQ